ncbi:MAG TPA: N-acetylmuramoyl-L-alanine amidase [Vicinamibacteria bacterium]|nr:N-acetylmuramoyl-L-alanine amidase [Vicinamibacteria bacterium]
MARSWRRSVWLGIALVLNVRSLAAQAPAADITIVAEEGRSVLPVSEFAGKPMVSLSAVAELIDAEIRPASEKAVLLSARGTVARISDESSFVPVGGKTVLLQGVPRLVAGEWFVPLDFLSRVLPSLSPLSVTYRDRERLLILGESFPRLEVRSQRDPSYTRVEVVTSPGVPIELSQTDREILLTIQAPYLDTDFDGEEILDGIVERIELERKERHYEVSVRLGRWFGTLKAFERTYPEHGVVLDLLKAHVPGAVHSTDVDIIQEDLRPTSERVGKDTGEGGPSELETIELSPDYATGGTDVPPLGPGGPARVRIVAIDPGHGGAEIGAEGGGGLIEKNVVLSIARQLRALLQQRLGLHVILTRDGDSNIGLDERAAIANNNKADLFISIHADASPRRDARGSSVYFLSYSSSGSGPSGSVAPVRGGTFSNGSELDFILWDMAQASHLSRSSQLAEILQEELQATTGGGKVNRGIKQNTFRVLKGATMPAVLVELGFISNPEEEDLLGTGEYQEHLAEALYRGVLRYKDAYEQEPRANQSVSSRDQP